MPVLLLYLTPYCLFRCTYVHDLDNCSISNISVLEIDHFRSPDFKLSGTNEYAILDAIKAWKEEFTDHTIEIIISNKLKQQVIGGNLLEQIKRITQVEPKEYQQASIILQSILATKQYFLEDIPSDNIQLTQINYLAVEHDYLTYSNNYQDQIHTINEYKFGVKQVHEYINLLLQQDYNYDSLQKYIQLNIQNLIKSGIQYSQQSITVLDEETSRLLLHSLGKNIQSQYIRIEDLINLVNEVIAQDFQSLRKQQFIEEDSLIYFSSKIILVTIIAEALGLEYILVSPEQSLRGYICQTHLDISSKNLPSIQIHENQWQNTTIQLLLKYQPEDYAYNITIAEQINQFIDSSYEILHFWSKSQKKLLLIAGLLHSVIQNQTLTKIERLSILTQIPSINMLEAQLIHTIVLYSQEVQLSKQSHLLDCLLTSQRLIARQFGTILRMILSLNISRDIKIYNLAVKNTDSDSLALKVLSPNSLDIEAINFHNAKQEFNNIFNVDIQLTK